MATYSRSVEYDITCDKCGKYFEEEDLWNLEETYDDLGYGRDADLHFYYYKCDVEGCGGEVTEIK